MELAEVALVLSKAAAYDRRTVGEADARAWHEVLGDVELVDALAAVARHYRDSTDWLMPAHLRRLAAQCRDQRRRVEGRSEVLALPSRYEDDEDRAVRVKRGMAGLRPVLEAIQARLAANRATGDGA